MATGTVHCRALRLDDPQDAHALLGLLDHYAQDPMGGGHPLGEHARAHLVAALRSVPGYHGGLALDGERAVGLVNCFTGFSTFAAQPLLNIHDLVVHADARGRGIGAALLDWARQRAQDLGCCKLTLEVLSGNTRARKVYEAAGYEPYALDPESGEALLMQKRLSGAA